MKKLLLALALLAAPSVAAAAPPAPAPILGCYVDVKAVNPVAVCIDAQGHRLLLA